MKKFLVIIAVLALTVVSSVAMAEVTVSGSIDIRNLSLSNTNTETAEPGQNADRNRTTQERIRVNIDAKNDNVKGRITIENDWDVWGRVEAPQGNGSLGCVDANLNGKCDAGEPNNNDTTAGEDIGRLKIREGWIDFQIPGASPAHVKVGHQFLQLGNGWFFRSGKYGSDAWLVGLPGKNTVAFVDVKVSEWNNGISDDTDAYVLLDNYKIDDTKTVGVYFARINDPRGNYAAAVGVAGGTEANLDTIGLWFNGKLGPINLQAEVNMQQGEVTRVAKAGVGQIVRVEGPIEFREYKWTAPGSALLQQDGIAALVRYERSGSYSVAVQDGNGHTSVCSILVQGVPVVNSDVSDSVRAIITESSPPLSAPRKSWESFVFVFSFISIGTLLFVGYTGSVIFRRRKTLGNIDVIRRNPKGISRRI